MSVTAWDKDPRWQRAQTSEVRVPGRRWPWRRENRRIAPTVQVWKHWLLLISKLFLIGLVAAGLIWSHLMLKDPKIFPIELVRIEGDWRYLEPDQIRESLQPQLAVSFFSLDVRQIHQTLQRIPWVDSVSIKRRWPGRVEIQVQERAPVAIWQNAKLLDTELKVFTPNQIPQGLRLPKLNGPSSQSEAMYILLQEFNRQLSPLNLTIDQLIMDDRHSLELWLDNGVHIKLGAESVRKRFYNFIRIYPHLNAEEETIIDSIDMRYPNGMAVQRSSRLMPEVGDGAVIRSSE